MLKAYLIRGRWKLLIIVSLFVIVRQSHAPSLIGADSCR